MTQQARGDNVARPPGGGRLADRLWLTCLIVICCAIAGRPRAASACTVPVFRYALDRWEADPFRLVVAFWAPANRLIVFKPNGAAPGVSRERAVEIVMVGSCVDFCLRGSEAGAAPMC
jgi:hypothetical protein